MPPLTDLITLSEYTYPTEDVGTKDLLKQFNLEVQLHGGRKPSELIKWSATSLPSLTHSRLHSLHRPSVAPATVTCFCQSVIGTTLAPLPFPRTHRALHGEEGTDRCQYCDSDQRVHKRAPVVPTFDLANTLLELPFGVIAKRVRLACYFRKSLLSRWTVRASVCIQISHLVGLASTFGDALVDFWTASDS